MDRTIVWIAPILIAGIFPLIRVFRGGRLLSSFFICWGLLTFWIFVFDAAAPFVVPRLNPGSAIEWSHPQPPPMWQHLIPGVFFGWFYAAVTILLALFLRFLDARLRPQISGIGSPNLAKANGCAIFGLVFLAMLGSLFAYFAHTIRPPKEAALLQTFFAHRSSFDRLRDMLQADGQIESVGSWGVHIRGGWISKPPEGIFPIQRFNEYLALFKDIGAKMAWRDDGPSPDVGIAVWRSGFAGDSVHIGFCWAVTVPQRQITSHDLYLLNHRSTGIKGDVYRHIERNWYLYTDIATGP